MRRRFQAKSTAFWNSPTSRNRGSDCLILACDFALVGRPQLRQNLRRRPRKVPAFVTEPDAPQRDRAAAHHPRRDLVGRLHADDNEPAAAQHAHRGQRTIPPTQLPGAHARPCPAVSDQAQQRRQHVGQIDEDGAHRGDGGVVDADGEEDRRRRHAPDGQRRRAAASD